MIVYDLDVPGVAVPELEGDPPRSAGRDRPLATANASQGAPTNNYWANSGKAVYSTSDMNNPVTTGAMSPQAVLNTGGSQAHLNMQPFLILNFCIALQGIFPSQT